MGNENLRRAQREKNDEFYTRLIDIEKELVHYEDCFKGKTVLCNCDDPTQSNFWRYFHTHFERLGLKQLISTHYEKEKPTYKMVYDGGSDDDIGVGVRTYLKGDGDFRSHECIEILRTADVSVTNPPFSLFREYIAQLVEYEKEFLIIGNLNAITYKETFPFIRDGRIWMGRNHVREFEQPDDSAKKNVCARWFTNIGIKRFRKEMELMTMAQNIKLNKKFIDKCNKEGWLDENGNPCYPKYDNYDAIEVPFVDAIPADYDGVMGVPITFLDKYCPEQFEILGVTQRNDDPFKTKKYTVDEFENARDLNKCGVIMVNGTPKQMYARILIRKRKDTE